MNSALLREFCGRDDIMLDLKKLFDGSLPVVDFSLSLDECDFVDDAVCGSFSACGQVTNHSGVVLLKGVVTPNLKVTCARCGKVFDHVEPITLEAKITDKLANKDEEEFIVISDFMLDVEELVRSALILELPSRFLCREDCKGLCPKCGCDLNENTCSCDMNERDPRWDVLKDFFSE